MMSALVRELPWALERVGALLEQDVAADGDWKIGAVERESGVIEAHLLVGLGRSPAKLRFSLQAEGPRKTSVRVELLSKSRWARASSCLARAGVLLDDLGYDGT